MGRWEARLGGSFQLCSPDHHALVPRGRKARAIVAYLCANAGARIRREQLIELLWADRGKAQARDSLRQAMLEIRRSAGGIIHSDRECVWIEADCLAPSKDDDTEFLADLDHITPELDAWLLMERRSRSEVRREALKVEAERFLSDGNAAEALKCAEKMERIDRYHEEWVRLAMRAEFLMGCPARIDQRFRAISDMLRGELGVEPAEQTRALRDMLIARLSGRAHSERDDLPSMKPNRPPAGPAIGKPAVEVPCLPSTRWPAIAAICTITVMAAGFVFWSATTRCKDSCGRGCDPLADP